MRTRYRTTAIHAIATALLISLGPSLDAQTPQSAQPTFEGASIRRNISGSLNSSTSMGGSGQRVFDNVTLRQIVTAAFGIESYQLICGLGVRDEI